MFEIHDPCIPGVVAVVSCLFCLYTCVQAELKDNERITPEELQSPKRRKLLGNGGVFPPVGGQEQDIPRRGGEGQGGGSAGPHQGDPSLGGGRPAASAAGGGAQSSTVQPGASGAAGPSTGTQRAHQPASDTGGLDQYRRQIPWDDVNPVVRKVFQLLYKIQSNDDTAVMDDVADPAPYQEGADQVDHQPVPDAV